MTFNQPIKFLIVGALNTLVGFIVYFICIKSYNIHYVTSLIISHIIGVIHSYFWNSRWTFRVKVVSISKISKFILVYSITFIINLLSLSIFVDFLQIDKITSQLFALTITTILSFLGHKYWSFRKNK
jgi:putative flippase GtrA